MILTVNLVTLPTKKINFSNSPSLSFPLLSKMFVICHDAFPIPTFKLFCLHCIHLSLDHITGFWLAISATSSSSDWPAPIIFFHFSPPPLTLTMMHTTHLQISTTKHIWKMELCQFPTNTAAFSTRVDIIFKGLKIWMFAEFYYFPLALITNYGPGMILFWLWPWRMSSGRILFCTFTRFYAHRKTLRFLSYINMTWHADIIQNKKPIVLILQRQLNRDSLKGKADFNQLQTSNEPKKRRTINYSTSELC